jgi:endonuclease YncB( thermonuclease family)
MTTWTVPATVIRVVDGDTIRLHLDLGWYVHVEANCRILGVNSPETSTPAGKQAKAWATWTLPPGTEVTYISACLDKYGRPLGDLRYGTPERDYGHDLIAAGQAQPYDGGAR